MTPQEGTPATSTSALSDLIKARREESFSEKLSNWVADQIPLVEALFVAVSLHVVAFPVIWFIGWALPWPKPPVITTIMEFDLTDWPKHSLTPKKIFEYRDPKLNQ
jgi:hypothetical protein